jgi:hypothetical protein
MSTAAKTFPKSRVCVIDVYPAFEQGLKKAVDFALKHDIQLNSADGKKVILGFCLEYIETAYTKETSQYPKVLCMGSKAKNERIENFIDRHFEGVMKNLPYPYCGKIFINSPDLETAAANSLKNIKTKRNFIKLAKELRLVPQTSADNKDPSSSP